MAKEPATCASSACVKSGAFLLLHLLFGTRLLAGDAVSTLTPQIQPLWEREYATGDWGGLRTTLADRGVIFNFTYTADGFGVVSGGIQRGVLYNGILDLGTDIDLKSSSAGKAATSTPMPSTRTARTARRT